MNHHWPILLAILIVGSAGVYGYFVQGENEERSKVPAEIRTLPTKYISTAPKVATTAVTPAAKPGTPAVNVVNEQPANVTQARTFTPPATPLTPGIGQPAGGVDRDVVFNNLRNALTQRFGVDPLQTKGGFAVTLEGARLEVDSVAWSISLYNDNKAAPAMQSENLQTMLGLVAANLDFDLNVAASTTADGKMTRRPISKLGKLSMVTDPAMNNSVIIRPIVKRPATPLPNGAAAAAPGAQPMPVRVPKPPAAPKVPQVPVKPPTTDQF